MPDKTSSFMDLQLTIKDVIYIVVLVVGFAGAFYQNKASVTDVQTENKYLRNELVEINARLDKQTDINNTVIRLETKIEGIEERTKDILKLLRNRT